MCRQIGSFEHNLTTDLLNHLVFLQKVFMKEVNEVIQKVSGKRQAFILKLQTQLDFLSSDFESLMAHNSIQNRFPLLSVSEGFS